MLSNVIPIVGWSVIFTILFIKQIGQSPLKTDGFNVSRAVGLSQPGNFGEKRKDI